MRKFNKEIRCFNCGFVFERSTITAEQFEEHQGETVFSLDGIPNYPDMKYIDMDNDIRIAIKKATRKHTKNHTCKEH